VKIYEKFKYHSTKIVNKLIVFYELCFSGLFLKIANKDLTVVIDQNRRLLKKESPFINDQIYKLNNYGIQERIFKKINEPVNCNLFYSDLIVYFCNKYFYQNLNYLEIGGSVLKNTLLVSEGLKKSTIVVFDINEINPLKEKNFLLNENNNNFYFKGSVVNEKETKEFHNKNFKKFNFVFSDALHTSEGLIKEYEFIYGNALQDNFIVYFDDLDFPELFETAKNIAFNLKKSDSNIEFITFKTFGWIGSNEPMHLNGLITNLNIFNNLKNDNIKLFKLQKINI